MYPQLQGKATRLSAFCLPPAVIKEGYSGMRR